MPQKQQSSMPNALAQKNGIHQALADIRYGTTDDRHRLFLIKHYNMQPCAAL